MKRALVLSILAASVLTACGGDDGTTTPTAPVKPPATGSQTGVLSDSPVQGVDYLTSSGVSGRTDAQGRYNFNPGDTVTFRLGSLVLGQQPAKGLLTPIDLAGDNPAKLSNLLVVLQSLDQDGNAGNGISIPAAAAAAMTNVDLATVSGTDLTQTLQTAMTAGGITTPVKTPEQAEAHFLEQARTLLSGNIWVASRNGVPEMALRVKTDGAYLFGEAATGDDSGGPGVEYGSVEATDVNAKGFALKASFASGGVDTNGEWGLSHLTAEERFAVSGDTLTVAGTEDGEAPATFTKMENDAKGIVGAWAIEENGTAPLKGHMLLFFSNGYMMMVDAIGDVPDVDENGQPVDDSCGGPGVEVGKYGYNAATGVITRQPQPLFNTNGCAGLWEIADDLNPTAFTLTLSADGQKAVLAGKDAGGDWSVALVRVSK